MSAFFHDGERAVQHATGQQHLALLNGRSIGPRIPRAARSFLEQQQYCALGWSAPAGEVWAAVLGGPPGFAGMHEDGTHLYLQLGDECRGPGEWPGLPVWSPGRHLGTLFIELATRRRLRVNGRVETTNGTQVTMAVEYAHGLCPKYIQRRRAISGVPGHPPAAPVAGHVINASIAEWIAGADTCFVASAHPDGPVDVSHRGGRPGFIRMDSDHLRVPDYPGNSLFNTLGNFALNPHAGMLFLDFATNRQLMVTGSVDLDLARHESAPESGGTGRWWRFRPTRWVITSINFPLKWTYVDASPFNP